jgi:hypothetical protein
VAKNAFFAFGLTAKLSLKAWEDIFDHQLKTDDF